MPTKDLQDPLGLGQVLASSFEIDCVTMYEELENPSPQLSPHGLSVSRVTPTLYSLDLASVRMGGYSL
jgi:hypothetical protein